jgi:hypothetical protein
MKKLVIRLWRWFYPRELYNLTEKERLYLKIIERVK